MLTNAFHLSCKHISLNNFVLLNCFFSQLEYEAGRVAKLFAGQLGSHKKIEKEFVPALKAFATCGWEPFEQVASYMLAMLLVRVQKRGVTLVTAALPQNVSFRKLGYSWLLKTCLLMLC